MITFICARCATEFPHLSALVQHRMDEPGPCSVWGDVAPVARVEPRAVGRPATNDYRADNPAFAGPPKLCHRCQTTRPRTDFYLHPGAADGLQGWCRDCMKADAAGRRVARRAQAAA